MKGLIRKSTKLWLAAAFAMCTAVPLAAQSSLEDALRQLNSENGRGYLRPLAELFSADMHGGWYHTANLGVNGFKFGLELVGTASAVKDEHRSYTATAPEGFTPSTFTTATVFGGEGATIQGPNGTSYRGSDGILDADYLPSVVPQIRLAIPGTEVMVRYFSSSLISALPEEDFPEIKLLGFGGRHSISQYFDNMPVDLSAGVFYSSLELGGESLEGFSAEYTGLSFGLQASRSFSMLTLYGGLSSDAGKMSLSYESTEPSEDGRVEVDIDVDRAIKFTAGAALNLGFLRLFGDASFGSATTYAAGLRIGM